jgi:hypothetical protein
MGTDDIWTELKRWTSALFDLRGSDPLHYAPGHAGWKDTKAWAKSEVLDTGVTAGELMVGGALGKVLKPAGPIVRNAIQGAVFAGEEAVYRGVVEGEGTTPKQFLTDTAVVGGAGLAGEMVIAGGAKAVQAADDWMSAFAQRASKGRTLSGAKAETSSWDEIVSQDTTRRINAWDSKVHPNSLDATGAHDLYVIRDAQSGRVYHFGETGRGWEVRGKEWIRKLNKDHGLETVVEPLKTVEGKRAARALESRYIDTFEKLFGTKPGAQVGDRFIQIQKSRH